MECWDVGVKGGIEDEIFRSPELDVEARRSLPEDSSRHIKQPQPRQLQETSRSCVDETYSSHL